MSERARGDAVGKAAISRRDIIGALCRSRIDVDDQHLHFVSPRTSALDVKFESLRMSDERV